MTQPDEPRISITGDGNVIGDYNTVIVYQGERSVSVADVLDACQGQVRSMVTEARHKYDPDLYVHRAIEQELGQFFDTPLDAGAANCYLIVAPAGSGKTNLLCHLAGERAEAQPVVLLMGGNLYLSPTSGLLGALQSELQTASRGVNFRSAEDCLHTLHRVAEETGRDALIVLDAINEHDKPIEMRKAVEDLLRKARGRRVKLVITCRDFYWGVFKGPFWEGATVNSLPADIAEDVEGAPGSGDFNRFTVDEQEKALGLYLKHYSISGRPIGDAVEQLRHPLLLRFFCEAYRGQEVEGLEDIRLKELFDRYWDQKLASVAERIIKGGDERVQEVLQEELGDYLLSVAAYMLHGNVRAIPEGDMPKATGLTEKRGDPRTLYGRIRDEFVILEERERGQGRRKAVQVAFVYEEFMEYTMARSLLRDWETAGLDEKGILAEIDGLTAKYASFAQVLGVMVYVGLMLRQQSGSSLWSELLNHGGPWRDVVLEAIRKLPESEVDGNVYLVLDEVLSMTDIELQVQALDIIKIRRIGQRAPRSLMQKVCDLAGHREEVIRRRVMLAIGYAPVELKHVALEKGLRDPLQGVRQNALTSAQNLPPESMIHLLGLTLHDSEIRVQLDAIVRLKQFGRPAISELVIGLREGDRGVRKEAAAALRELGWAPPTKTEQAWLAMALQDWVSCTDLGASAVEPLVMALRDADSWVRKQAAEALHQLGWVPLTEAEHVWQAIAAQNWVDCAKLGASALERLVMMLRDDERDVRQGAAWTLGQIGDTRAVEPLVEALLDGNNIVRWQAVKALGRLRDKRSVEPLLALLVNPSGRLRGLTVEVLGQLGDVRAAEPLLAVLRDTSSYVRRVAARALGQLNDTCAAEPLAAMLNDSNDSVRWEAARALAQLGDTRATEPCAAMLRNRHAEVRSEAAEALSRIGWAPPSNTDRVWYAIALQDWPQCEQLGSCAVKPLVAVLHDKDSGVREKAVEVLGQLGDTRAVGALAAALQDPSRDVRRCAVQALGRLDSVDAVEPLLASLRDLDSDVRGPVIELLGRLGDVRAVEPLVAILRQQSGSMILQSGSTDWSELVVSDGNEITRRQAATALVEIGQTSVSPLVPLLRDSNGDVREQAAEALRRLDWMPATEAEQAWQAMALRDWVSCARLGPCAVEPLMMALHDRDSAIRGQAATALGQLGDHNVVESLIAALRDSSDTVCERAAEALGQLRDVRAVKPLLATLHDRCEGVDQSRRRFGRLLSWSLWSEEILRSRVTRALVMIGSPAIDPLIAALCDTRPRVRQQAAEALGRLGDPHAIESLAAALSDEDLTVRQLAIEALMRLGDPRAIESLGATLGDKDLLVRQLGIKALIRLGGPSAVVAALGSRELAEQRLAIQALKSLRNPSAASPLFGTGDNGDGTIHKQVVEALATIGLKNSTKRHRRHRGASYGHHSYDHELEREQKRSWQANLRKNPIGRRR